MQFLNALACIIVIVLGSEIEVNVVLFINASSPTSVTVYPSLGIVGITKEEAVPEYDSIITDS